MQSEIPPIRQWAIYDRPREKLLRKSPQALTDSELLAILIGSGIPERDGNPRRNALEVARDLLELGHNSLRQLGKLSVQELMKVRGIGKARAVTIAAVLELGRRRQADEWRLKSMVKSSHEAVNYLKANLEDLRQEAFAVLFLTSSGRIKHFEFISHGGITSTIADPRVIFRKALEHESVSLILCHNHPSGSLQPSKADEDLTIKLREAGKFLDIKILDHIIISDEGYFSFADEGRM
jgi:DNA repair protein RadC